jgi:hypothetical protein
MITVITEFKLAEKISTEQAREIFLSTAPTYLGVAGLLRKSYFLTQDGTKVGGIYLWQSREDADRTYTADWQDFVRAKYGTEPSITYLECPVIVDNVSNEIFSN